MRISSWASGFVSLALSSTIHAQGVQTQVQPMRWSAGGGNWRPEVLGTVSFVPLLGGTA